MGFRQTEFAWQPGVFLAREHGGTCSAADTIDLDDVGACFCDADCDGANVVDGHQLDAYGDARIDRLEIVDELGEILNRIDVMVRRGTDQIVSGFTVANFGDLASHLFAHQLAAFAWFGALGHLDLQFLTVDEVFGVDTESPTCNLPDARAEAASPDITVESEFVGVGLSLFDNHLPEIGPCFFGNIVAEAGLASFARVTHAVDFVESGGDVLVGIFGERTVTHCCAPEMVFGQVEGGLDSFDRYRCTERSQVKEIAKNGGGAGIHHRAEVAEFGANCGWDISGQVGVFAAGIGFVGFGFWSIDGSQGQFTWDSGDGCFSQCHAHFGVECVVIAVSAEDLHVFGAVEAIPGIVDEFGKIDSANTTREISEVLHEIRTEAHSFKKEGTTVAFCSGDAHFADDFLEAVLKRGKDIFQAFAAGEGPFLFGVWVFEGEPVANEPQHEIGVNSIGAKGDEAGNVVSLLDIASLNHKAAPGPQAFFAEVGVYRTQCEERGDRGEVAIERVAIGEANNIEPLADGQSGFRSQFGEACLEAFDTFGEWVDGIEGSKAEYLVAADFVNHAIGENGAGQFELPAGDRTSTAGAVNRRAPQVTGEGHGATLSVRVDWRVGDLGKCLLEVFKECLVLLAKNSEDAVEAHGAEGLFLKFCHVFDENSALELPPVSLQELIDSPAAAVEDFVEWILDRLGKVEGLGDDDLGFVELVQVWAEIAAHFLDNATHDSVTIHAFAGTGVDCDHLAWLQLAAGDDFG